MPTLVLQNTSPFECLFRRTLDYNFLHTFGCLCFPFLHPILVIVVLTLSLIVFMSPVMFVFMKMSFFLRSRIGNILTGTSYPTYLSSILSAYYLPNRPQPQPNSTLCRTPPAYPFAHRFCHPFITIPHCHTINICLFFQ